MTTVLLVDISNTVIGVLLELGVVFDRPSATGRAHLIRTQLIRSSN